MAKVKQIRMTDSGFLRKLRTIIADTSRLVITNHAKQRMKERRVSTTQLLMCLRMGRLCEPVHQSIHGDWKATVEHICAGDVVRVAVALERQESEELAVVITVMG